MLYVIIFFVLLFDFFHTRYKKNVNIVKINSNICFLKLPMKFLIKKKRKKSTCQV